MYGRCDRWVLQREAGLECGSGKLPLLRGQWVQVMLAGWMSYKGEGVAVGIAGTSREGGIRADCTGKGQVGFAAAAGSCPR